MTKTAHLRVYTPDTTEDSDPVPGFVRSYGMLSEAEGAEDWVAEWHGVRVVCPRHLRLRVLESTIAFANAFRGLGAGLIPEEAARAAVLASLADVDLVTIFEEDTPETLITALRPDVLVKGADYTIDQVVGADLVRSWGGRVMLAELLSGNSTTATIARLRG